MSRALDREMADTAPPRTPRSTPPARWALVRDDEVFALGAQVSYLGRSPECALVFDDPSISRRQASVHVGPSGPVVLDGGSRHGTLVNGRRIEGPTALAHGDQISIGSVALSVQDLSRPVREAQPTLRLRAAERSKRTTETLRDMRVTGEYDPMAALVSEIEILAHAGQGGQAKNLVRALLALCGDRAQGSGLDDASLRRSAGAVLRAADAKQPTWIDDVVRLHRNAHRLMHASTLDHLERGLERVPGVDLAALVAYSEWLRSAGVAEARGEYGAYCLRRLEDIVSGNRRGPGH